MDADINVGQGRIALVTGAGRGIGREVASQLLARGWRVAVLGRSLPGLAGAVEIQGDVTDEAQVAAAFQRIDEELGRLDVLINNAGSFGPAGTIDEVPVGDWRATIETNLTGSFLCAREAFARMRAHGGRIINNGSVSARRPRPHSAAYAASKHGLAGLTRAIALDGRPHGISATQVDIGNAATGFLQSNGLVSESLQADGRRIPEPSFDVAEAARAIVYVAELPAGVVVHDFVITAAGMPYDGRG